MSKIDLKKNILTSGSFRALIMITSFFTSFMSARYLGVEIKGVYSYLYTVVGFAWLILDMGVYRSIPYLVRKFPNKLQEVFNLSVFLFILESLLLGILGLCCIGFWSSLLGLELSRGSLILIVMLITSSKFGMQLQSLYVGMDKIWNHSIAQLLSALFLVVMLLIGLLFAKDANKLMYMLAIGVGSQFLLVGSYLGMVKWERIRFSFDPELLKIIYSHSFRVFLSSLFVSFLLRVDIILIKRALSFSEVGIYSIAAHIIDVLQLASNVVGVLLLVKLADCTLIEDKWHIMRKILLVFSLILGAANIGFLILGKWLLGIFFGSDFVPVYGVYLWLIPASFSLSFGSLFNNYLNSKGFPVISIILPALALGTNVALNLLFIPIWGIYGAALATSVSYTLWFLSIVAYEHFTTGKKLLFYLIPRKADFTELRDYALSLIPLGR